MCGYLKHSSIEVHPAFVWNQVVFSDHTVKHVHEQRLATADTAVQIYTCGKNIRNLLVTSLPCCIERDVLSHEVSVPGPHITERIPIDMHSSAVDCPDCTRQVHSHAAADGHARLLTVTFWSNGRFRWRSQYLLHPLLFIPCCDQACCLRGSMLGSHAFHQVAPDT